MSSSNHHPNKNYAKPKPTSTSTFPIFSFSPPFISNTTPIMTQRSLSYNDISYSTFYDSPKTTEVLHRDSSGVLEPIYMDISGNVHHKKSDISGVITTVHPHKKTDISGVIVPVYPHKETDLSGVIVPIPKYDISNNNMDIYDIYLMSLLKSIETARNTLDTVIHDIHFLLHPLKTPFVSKPNETKK